MKENSEKDKKVTEVFDGQNSRIKTSKSICNRLKKLHTIPIVEVALREKLATTNHPIDRSVTGCVLRRNKSKKIIRITLKRKVQIAKSHYGSIGLAGGLNQYEYGAGNPMTLVDPTGLDPGDKFPSAQAAGMDALNFINPKSIFTNREYGGYVFQNSDGTYSATIPIKGTLDGINLGRPPLNTVADYHTHGAYDPRYYNEGFSFTDIWGNALMGTIGFLGTPKGTTQVNSAGKFKVVRVCSK